MKWCKVSWGMMVVKILIISDIHGSYASLEKLVDVMDEVSNIFILGDYFSYAGEIDERILSLFSKYQEKIIGILGNCDFSWCREILPFPLYQNYLFEVDSLKFFLRHGHISYDDLIDDDYIVLGGHTHQYQLTSHYINPGSITYPRGGQEKTYIIYQKQLFTLYNVDTKKKIKSLRIEEGR